MADETSKPMNLDRKQFLEGSPDPHHENELRRAIEETNTHYQMTPEHVASLACQVLPRPGDLFTLIIERGNPFDTTRVEVIEVKNGWVQYFFSHTCVFGAKAKTANRVVDFGSIYEPTPETIEARKRGISTKDWLAYVADQVEQDREEARRVAHEEQIKRDLDSE